LIKTEINDHRLVKRVLNGDKKSFDLLVLKYQQRVSAVLGRYKLSPEEVMDITQETFIKAYRSIEKFRGDSKFYTWLYRIAINTAKNHLIAKSRRPPDIDIDVYEITSLLKSTNGPESEFEGERLSQVVESAISKLPQDLKSATIMREYEGMSYEDISAIMECPVGTVRSRIFRARESIDKEVKNII
jgi:RNA polymerase sigma-70 factor (ECF subfamily)